MSKIKERIGRKMYVDEISQKSVSGPVWQRINQRRKGGKRKTAEICLFKPSSIIEIHFQLEEKTALVILHSLKSVKLPLLFCCCCTVIDQRPFQRI